MQASTVEDIFPSKASYLPTVRGEDIPAADKARQLLQAALPDEMWSAFVVDDVIEVTGQRGIYLILPHSRTKIYDFRSAQCVAYACIELSVIAPDYDRMLAEYLLLKNDEDQYWNTANIFAPASDVVTVLLALLEICWLLYLLQVALA